ncbi:hypothetical protein HB662_15100 [Roseomonas frigidaquae]|uniref:Lipoprotein n=1 Tax=Falsiroseomonas frigidaquae TaxID=487318 RepID=A0ABX1F188_9PROT|nr:hypothetical protein [Falsiroseomonas frigidaquae]NKE46112.1 hypothetical protein [Falsiroseomonas frigidaquae]
MSSSSRRFLLFAPLALAACSGLPQPFRGRPGAVARRLRLPPGYRVAVPHSTQLLLTDGEATTLSRALAAALVANEVPAVSGPGLPLDWQLVVAADREAGQVVPRYALRDADGQALGMLVGRPVPASEWAEGGTALLERIASEAAAPLANLVGRIDAQRRTGDESAVGGGPPVLRLLPVRGAPGDGNRSLTARMRDSLAGLGFRVQDEAQGAQFAVQGEVTVAASGPGLQRVEIVWIVSRRDGEDLGRVLQLNEVPANTLNGLWGDVAFVVAEEASGGVRDVVFNAGGFPGAANAAAQAGAAATPATTPATGAPAPAR